ncbi:hypothetical protein GT755_33825 [Herbidospora sp. NEAU-GS84]|uniref:Uncharacterized protein n=1 Tax=Herbidospora solisilvae TaxID=2696284 RepID=A0A7C9JHF2_9ACTN|nr:DUF4279 domain-containing protein [Herbidospora solisilvae]NAS26641.1 hypothetical protein [Herbidospora solisilvae]
MLRDYVRVISDDGDPHEVTALIGITPDRTFRAGEIGPSGEPRTSTVWSVALTGVPEVPRDEILGCAPDIVARLRTLVDRGWRLSVVLGPASADDDPDMARGFVLPMEEMWSSLRVEIPQWPPVPGMNEEFVARDLAACGVRLIGIRRYTGVPPQMAARIATVGPEDGRRDQIFKADDPDLAAAFNRAWYATAVEHGLFSEGERFLIAMDQGKDPDFFQAREESDAWRNPRWWELVWALVELEPGWDLGGAGSRSRILGSGGHPAFDLSSADGSVIVGATWWEDDTVSLMVLTEPHRVETLRAQALRILEGSTLDAEKEELTAWLARER